MNKEIITELAAINNSVNDMLNYCETVAQLATLAKLQEHFIKFKNIILEDKK